MTTGPFASVKSIHHYSLSLSVSSDARLTVTVGMF